MIVEKKTALKSKKGMKLYLTLFVILLVNLINGQEIILSKNKCFKGLTFTTDISNLSEFKKPRKSPENSFISYTLERDNGKRDCYELFDVEFDSFLAWQHSNSTNTYRFVSYDVKNYVEVIDYLKEELTAVLGSETYEYTSYSETVTENLDFYWLNEGVLYNLFHNTVQDSSTINLHIALLEEISN